MNKDLAYPILLFFIGLSRMTFLSYEFEANNRWLQVLAPKPNVFVNFNYFQKKVMRLTMQDGSTLEIDFEKNQSWPFRDTLMASYYPLLRVLDRPAISSSEEWNRYVDYFICNEKGNVFKENSGIKNTAKIQSFILLRNKKWKKVQEYECSL